MRWLICTLSGEAEKLSELSELCSSGWSRKKMASVNCQEHMNTWTHEQLNTWTHEHMNTEHMNNCQEHMNTWTHEHWTLNIEQHWAATFFLNIVQHWTPLNNIEWHWTATFFISNTKQDVRYKRDLNIVELNCFCQMILLMMIWKLCMICLKLK